MAKVYFSSVASSSTFNEIDWIGIIRKFQGMQDIKSANLVGTFSNSPDNHFYEIETNVGTYYIYEVDNISDLNYEIKLIKSLLGEKIELVKVIATSTFENSTPVKAALTYEKSDNWNEIQEYVTDYSGTASYYFKFLIKKLSL